MARRRWSRRQFMQTVGTVGATAALLGPRVVAHAAKPKHGGPLRFGVQTSPQNTTYEELVSVWKEADDLGFDSAFAFDHFMPIMSNPGGPCFEGWTLLAA